jgi:HD-like signal output (HDOD) protein
LEALRSELRHAGQIDSVARIISGDPGLACKILQITSTSFFGTPRGILTPTEATRRLGSDVIRALDEQGALPDARPSEIDVVSQSKAARRTAAVARACASQVDATLVDLAETAGLFHDCGLIALASGDAAMQGSGSGDAHTMTTPADAGAFLLALWGLPDPIVEAVARHRHPGAKPTKYPMLCAIIHVAHVLVDGLDDRLDRSFLDPIVGASRLEEWRNIARSIEVAP